LNSFILIYALKKKIAQTFINELAERLEKGFIRFSRPCLSTMAEVIQEVQKAETDAKEIVEESKEIKAEKIRKAEEKASNIIEEAHKRAENEKRSEINDFKSDLEHEISKIIEDAEDSASTINEEASQNMESAVDFLMEEFEEEFLR